MSAFRTRAITALGFVIVMTLGVFTNQYSFVALFGVITLLSLWEFFGLTLEKNSRLRTVIATLLCTAPFVALAYNMWIHQGDTSAINQTLISCFLGFFVLFIFEMFLESERPFQNLAFIIFAFFYITLPYMLLNFAAFHPGTEGYEPMRVFGLLLLVWANDTGAYLVGSRIGKTPLLPRISPKKTWEGTLGGVALTLLAAYLLHLVPNTFALSSWLVLGLIVAVFGSLGDLVESMLKRSLGVKDSGTLLPGHGGLLDRFDAFMFMLPFAGVYILLMKI